MQIKLYTFYYRENEQREGNCKHGHSRSFSGKEQTTQQSHPGKILNIFDDPVVYEVLICNLFGLCSRMSAWMVMCNIEKYYKICDTAMLYIVFPYSPPTEITHENLTYIKNISFISYILCLFMYLICKHWGVYWSAERIKCWER